MKSIILCAPSDFGLFYAIKSSLEEIGYKVYGFPIEDGNYKYKNIFTRINNIFRKAFLGDTQYKNRLKHRERNIKLNDQIKSISSTDFALFIRPDMYPLEFIKKVQKISSKTVAYHWDSIERFPNIVNYIEEFESFYVFHHEDSIKFPKTKLLTNFFLPDDSTPKTKDTKKAFLIGSDYANRINDAIQLMQILTPIGYYCDFTLKTKKAKHIAKLQKQGIQTIKTAIPYNHTLKSVKLASLIIDLHNTQQTGLSFRVFEALNYNKKLITTNPYIKNYDFYHANNIFVWDGSNHEEIKTFLQKEYSEIDENVKSKYSLNNWIKYVIDDDPYIKITID